MRFDWGQEKNETNRAKHGLSFEAACEPFRSGADYLEICDEEHSEKEDRFLAIGSIKRGVIVVAFTAREDEILRLLSARIATRGERERFEGHQRGGYERRDS